MIDSIFLLSSLGEILIEKHYRAGTPRSAICDLFWDRGSSSTIPTITTTTTKSFNKNFQDFTSFDEIIDESEFYVNNNNTTTTTTNNDLDTNLKSNFEMGSLSSSLPVIDLGNGQYAAHIKRGDLTLVAAVSRETQPLMIIEFLHRFADILTIYLGSPDEIKVKDAFSTVYQLLDEVMDGGFPLVTEPNALKEMIAPPSFLNKIAATVSGTSTVMPVLSHSSTAPWRKKDTKYTQNEIFLDIEEEVNAIIGSNGIPQSVDLGGVITVTCRLSGMPQIMCRFEDPYIMNDVAFHPCVDLDRWERERVLIFIPPDGTFELLRYRVSKETVNEVMQGPIAPVYCNVVIAMPPPPTPFILSSQNQQQQQSNNNPLIPSPIHSGSLSNNSTTTTTAKIEIIVGSRPHSEPSEQVSVHLPLPSTARFLGAKSLDGSVIFNDRTCTWRIGSFNANKSAVRLSGSFTVSNEQVGSVITVLLEFSSACRPLSKLRISSLEIMNESYRFFKGVKTIVKSGEFQIRAA
jgi:AP-3 complex subunit mu